MTLFTLIIISLSAELTSALVSYNFFVSDKRCEKILEKRHGDPIYESKRKHGLYSEKNLFAECFLYKFTEKSGRILYLDGLYIAGHKYFGKDPRKGSKRGFFRKFPSPDVAIDRNFESQVRLQKECQKSGKDCVRAVYVYGGRRSGTVQNFLYNNVTVPSYNPFEDELEAFKFKTTAMYYLCWHTMKRDPAMKFYFKEPPEIYQTDPKIRYDMDISCLGQLYETKDIPQNLRDTIIKTKDKTKISDYRATYENMKANPFLCAELWFCPDPCYPGFDANGFNPSQDLRQAGNPCRELKNPKCQVVPEANVNFRQLTTNKFTTKCECQSTIEGSEWYSPYGACVCPTGMVENEQAKKCVQPGSQPEQPGSQAGSASRDFGGESEFSDQEGGSDYGFGGDFGSYDEEPGLFGMFSGSESSRVGWGVVALQCLLGVIL